MEPKSRSKSKIHTLGFIQSPITLKCGKVVLLISFILVLIFGCFVFSPSLILYVRKSASYFTVVLDCGSTGTRVNVYEWMPNGSMRNGEFPILVNSYPGNLTRSDGCKYHCMQTEPGMAMFVGNASGLRASLKPLIRWAEKWVPSGKRGVTPIYVLATAGMRRLPIGDASRIMEDVADIVKEHGFFYQRDFIRVLSGREEAYYGWVALNYKMRTLGNTSRSHTLGLLDLGGSSLQVVTEIDEFRADEHVFRSKIGSVEHKLLAYSLQEFGFNEAFDRAVAILSQTQAPQESTGKIFKVRHPCLGSDFVQNYTCRGCFRQKPSSSEDFSNQMMIYGDPNWERCKVLATEVATNLSNLEQSKVAEKNCVGLLSYRGDRMRNLIVNSQKVTRYHALSGFFAVYNMLNLSSRANLTKMWETGQRLCSQSWVDQNGVNGLYCFRILYMTSLIQDALCLSNLEIIFGTGDVSWTLGAALIEVERSRLIAADSQTKCLATQHNWMLYSSISLFLLLVCVLIIVYRSQIKLPMPGRKITSGRSSLPSYLYPKLQPN